MLVRLQPPELNAEPWLGRQPADHPHSNEGTLGLDSYLGRGNLSSWSSLECSPPCQGGDHGFKSHRGRLLARYANRESGQAQTLVMVCGFDSHPCYWNMRRLGIGEPKWL